MGDNLPTKFDAELRHRFLAYYALTGQLQKSAQECGISPATVRSLQKKDPDFAAAMEEAKEDFKEAIERELIRRAVMGWDEPVYQKGELVGEVRKYDSNLLAMLIKKLDPTYKERHEVSVNVSPGVLAVPAAESKEDWEKRHAVDADFQEVDEEEQDG